MKLYKNVDICDLASILEKGLLPLDECENDNWENDKRAKNPTDRVYLFKPIAGKCNSYPWSYGVALLEVEVDDYQQSQMCENDRHREDYIEYTTERVAPERIKAIYVPEIFKTKLRGIDDYPEDLMPNYSYHWKDPALDESIMRRITWCGISAEYYGEHGREPADDRVLERFARTAYISCTTGEHYFRGTGWNFESLDLCDVNYIFNAKE